MDKLKSIFDHGSVGAVIFVLIFLVWQAFCGIWVAMDQPRRKRYINKVSLTYTDLKDKCQAILIDDYVTSEERKFIDEAIERKVKGEEFDQ